MIGKHKVVMVIIDNKIYMLTEEDALEIKKVLKERCVKVPEEWIVRGDKYG